MHPYPLCLSPQQTHTWAEVDLPPVADGWQLVRLAVLVDGALLTSQQE